MFNQALAIFHCNYFAMLVTPECSFLNETPAKITNYCLDIVKFKQKSTVC